jgi:hypothetical protein
MKAKEYAAQYKANPTNEELARIAVAMFVESKTLIEQRHISTYSGLFAILDEIDNKWRCFVRLTDDLSLKSDGFKDLLKFEMSFAYYPWMDYRNRIKDQR